MVDIQSLEKFIIENWPSKQTLRSGNYNGNPDSVEAFGAPYDLLFDRDTGNLYKKVNGSWRRILTSGDLDGVNIEAGIDVVGSQTPGETPTRFATSTLRFDSDSGLLVEETDDGEVEVSLGSHFKTIAVPRQSNIVASGEDLLNLVPGTGVDITTDPSSNTIQIDVDQDSLSEVAFTGSFESLSDKPDFKQVAKTGSYEDLIDKPSLERVARTGNYQDLINRPNLQPVAFTGSYQSLVGTPDFSQVAFTGNYNDLSGTPTFHPIAFSGSYSDLTDKPDISYENLSDKPDLKPVATSGSYSDLSDKPDLEPVATSGDYQDLTNKPDFENIGSSSVFVVDVFPQDSEETVNLSRSETVSRVVESFSTTTSKVTVKIEFDGGKKYRGNYTANGVPFSNYQQIEGDRRFTATVDLDLDFSDPKEIQIEGNGGKTVLPFSGTQPANITLAEFSGIYPRGPNGGIQSELKENDKIELTVEADEPFVKLIIFDFGALKSQTFTFGATSQVTREVVVANRGTTPQDLKGKLRVETASNGALSPKVETDNTVTLNNLKPTVNLNSPVYPDGQEALKDSEEASIEYFVNNADTQQITSSELSTTDDDSNLTILASLNSNGRSQGYRVSGNNLTFQVTRNANGSQNQASTLVQIAHNEPDWKSGQPNPPLRSDEGGIDHAIALSFDQQLLNVSYVSGSIGDDQGTFQQINEKASRSNWELIIRVNNQDVHQSASYSFQVEITNLANRTVTRTGQYQIRGFRPQSYTFDTFSTSTLDVGITVVNPDNLVVESSNPPLDFFLVSEFGGDPAQIKFNAPSTIQFNNPELKNLASGEITVDVEERI